MGQLIEQEYDIKRAYEQNSDAVQAWLQGEHPGIEQPAKRTGVTPPESPPCCVSVYLTVISQAMANGPHDSIHEFLPIPLY